MKVNLIKMAIKVKTRNTSPNKIKINPRNYKNIMILAIGLAIIFLFITIFSYYHFKSSNPENRYTCKDVYDCRITNKDCTSCNCEFEAVNKKYNEQSCWYSQAKYCDNLCQVPYNISLQCRNNRCVLE